jgi:hypothetical protein
MNKSLGYYTVNNKKFESKIHALIEATKSKKKVKWIFNDEVFENFNWSVEPQESLDQLYDQRARDLREKYDYLVLCYSGGSDSNNILEAFIRQGLLIDEIVTNFIIDGAKPITNSNITNQRAENHNAEWDLLTKGRMQYIYTNMPGVKISNFDMSKPILEHFNNHQDGSWILKCREWANPMSTARYNIIYDTALRKKFDQDRKVGVILGVDKPYLMIADNHLYIQFVDTTANITPITEHIKSYDNTTVEFFYWSPDSVKLLCKQAHVMLKYLRLNSNFRKLWDINDMTSRVLSSRTLRENILKQVIYTTWNNEWFQAEKGTIGWTNVNDRWFFEYFKDSVEYTAWKNGIQYLFNNISPDFMASLNNTSGSFEKFKAMMSSSYYIGKIDNAQ